VTEVDRVEVLSGLAPGDRIVVDGADKLRDGAKINVRPAADTNALTKSPDQMTGPEKAGGKKQRSDGGQKQ
jgi:multidrug efflux system membrane fusion protein